MRTSSEFRVQFLTNDRATWNTASTFPAELGNGAESQAFNRLNECTEAWPHDQWRLIEVTTKVIVTTQSVPDTVPTEFVLVRTCDGDIDAPCSKPAKHRYDAMGAGFDGWLCNYHDAKIVGKKEDNAFGVDYD